MSLQDAALARRAVACDGWRWVAGMLSNHGRVADAYCLPLAIARGDVAIVPDLTDPCTVGALLALVREAHGQPFASAWGTAATGKLGPYWEVTITPGKPLPHTMLGHGDTEAAALVEALEGAP